MDTLTEHVELGDPVDLHEDLSIHDASFGQRNEKCLD